MSQDGEGKPPNPFAPHRTATSNPFDDLMGGDAASAPNPFGGPAPPSLNMDPDGPPAITVLRNPQGDNAPSPPKAPSPPAANAAPNVGQDAMAALGLELAPREPPPKSKAVRPELAEWRMEVTTGAGVVATMPPRQPAASNPRLQALPPSKKGGPLKKVIGAAVVVIVVLAGASIGKRVLDQASKEPAAPQVDEGLSQTDQLLQLGIRPENAPDCFTQDKGFQFSFVDSSGQTVVVNSIADVPVLYRINARCLPQ